MNIQQYTQKHGTGALFRLAVQCKIKPSYIQNLLYTVNSKHNPVKTPSIKLAKKLTEASGGELTMEGLASPTRIERTKGRPRMKKGFREALFSEPVAE